MMKQGQAWIESDHKRGLERALVAPLLPAAGGVAVVHSFRPVIHHVPRSLYPGDRFTQRKLGDPDRDTLPLRWLRKAMVDELPQILDVWNGSMTLVGPRADEPEHIEQLFDAIEDSDLRDRWKEVRFRQRPGIISSYAVHSHRNNLEGATESARFSEDEERARNAETRAVMDVADFEAASMVNDWRLIAAAANMAVANYSRYTLGMLAPQAQPSAEI